ncbi:MAG: carboxypeptidase-like regulatory domain-containing protein [Flavobacteriaceae bacterium]|nr:carboxypeptidase-like regulatory domain-containing protein [Flavobacteriaceae bacterium]
MKKISTLLLLFVFSQSMAQKALAVRLKDSSQLKLSSLHISVNIVGNFAQTTYDMQFYNGLDRTLEGELVFPLAEGQAVSEFAMDVNGQLRAAVIVERELARVAFESTVRQTIDPGLLEKTEGNNYKARIYPILPKSNKHIVLTFEQQLTVIGEEHLYELPLDFKEKLDDFALDMKVYQRKEAPLFKQNGYKGLVFGKSDGPYTATLQRRHHAPNDPIVLALPNAGYSTNIQGHKDYFYFNKKLKPNTRVKRKPRSINLMWDASFSAQHRNLEKELALLDGYFEYLQEVDVRLVVFSNRIHKEEKFKIRAGKWEALRTILSNVAYDGGTAFGGLESLPIAEEALLFSDGLDNLGGLAQTEKYPIYTINSNTSANHATLRRIATESGGNYLNLGRLPNKQAQLLLQRETFQFLGTNTPNTINEVYPREITNVTEDFAISGRYSEESSLELLFGYGGKVTERIRVDITDPNPNTLAKRLWAKLKLADLNLNKKANKAQIVTLAKSHHLITDYTSMLILDRLEDYVRYRIEPPQAMKADYKARLDEIASFEQDDLQELEERREWLLDDYEDITDWYQTTYPIKTTPKIKNEATASSPQPVTPTNTTSQHPTAQVAAPIAVSDATTINNEIDTSRPVITGVVVDGDNLPLPGASIIVKGTNRGTQTDFDGNFAINAETDEALEISYIGFNTTQVPVGQRDRFSIKLETSSQALDEVVVTAMGISREKKALGYAVTTVTSEEWDGASQSDVARLLSGKAAGVQITEAAGASGTAERVVIRGYNSISSDSNPLFIVDGHPMVAGEVVLPEDIEEIEELKGLSAGALYGTRGRNGVVVITTKKGKTSNQEAIEGFSKTIADKIAVKPWDPNTPYLKALRQEATTALAYKKYFELRENYVNTPSFYLDVSDFFDAKGRSDLALTVLTNLMEIELQNHEVMRALGYKLEYFEAFELAAVVYRKVLELRPEEPQSYRDLALVYEETGHFKKAYDLLNDIYSGALLEKDEEERFYGIEQLAFVELSRMVHKYGKQLKLTKKEKDRFKNLPVDVRVVIDWNHSETDIDLWVVDPMGEKAYYGNTETKIGGRMSEDMTEGYGPEEFMLKKAPKGTFQVMADYFADDLQKISGPTILKATFFTNYGRSNEKKRTLVVRLDKEEDELEIGSLIF